MKSRIFLFFFVLSGACQQSTKRAGVVAHQKSAIAAVDTTKAVAKPPVPESDFSDDTTISRNWYYNNLSPDFNFRVYLKVHCSFDWAESEKFDVIVMNKQDSVLQKISVPEYGGMTIFGGDFPVYVRSYQTTIGTKRTRMNGYYGHFIVQDFNFDSLYDFATVKNIPMSGTPTYTFYLQNKNGKFEKSSYLTNEISFYPEVDPKNRVLIAQSYTGCCMFYWDYYKMDMLGNFRKVKSVEKDVSGD